MNFYTADYINPGPCYSSFGPVSKGLILFTTYSSSLTRLMVFIDESGTTDVTESVFTTAAVWCMPSNRGGAQKVLGYTTERIKDEIKAEMGGRPNEIHHSGGLHRFSDRLLEIVHRDCYDDFSIEKRNLRLIQQPIMYSCNFVNPSIEAILPEYDSKTYGNIVRARAIAKSLQPLFMYGGEEPIEAEVILDDKVWSKAVSMCSRPITEALNGNKVHIQFSCHDSMKIPGVQLADLAAGVSHSFQREGKERKAYELIGKRTIIHIGERRAPGVLPL